ncbi:MAG: GNAT family N-acetyltransferase [Reyranellaceae bacterium]
MIRERNPADDEVIREVNDAAFGGSDESRLVEDLRAAELAMIELVAVEQSAIVGHILFSRLAVALDGRPIRTLALAPMSVWPGRQRRGIGSGLVRHGLNLARERGWQAVIVLGHPGYYPRLGFSARLARPLKAPFTGDAFMTLELVPRALHGVDGQVVYPPPFGIVS